MRKYDLINKISCKNVVPRIKNMQVLDEQSKAYFNFINTLHSESTRKSYRFCLEKFLNHYEIDLLSFLKLPQQDITNFIIKYLVDRKVSRQYKNLITATLKHACEINDIVLNWKKIKKFVHPEKTGNETNERDRAYTHQEIQKILGFCDQRIRTVNTIAENKKLGVRVTSLFELREISIDSRVDLNKLKEDTLNGKRRMKSLV